MSTLAADSPRVFELGDVNELPIIANDIIYEGAAVGDNASGYMRPLVAGDPFRGFAESKVDNTGGSAGDKTVRLLQRGLVQLSISGLAITDVGSPVYASDDDTFTLTVGSNTHIGAVHRFVSSGVGIVYFDVPRPPASVASADIVAEAVTTAKMADLTRGSILTGQTAGNRPTALDAKGDGKILVGDGTDLASVAVSGDVTLANTGAVTIAALAVETGMLAADAVDGTKLADDAVSLEHLDSGITPSHIVVAAGEFTTVGGDADEQATVAGVVATDIVVASLLQKGASPATLLTSAAGSGVIDFVMSGNPSNDHIISYMVLRAAA